MKGRLPGIILKRPKQAYRAPGSGFLSSAGKQYVPDLLSEKDLKLSGIFSPDMVGKLMDRVGTGNKITETENMAISGIISTQVLYHQYILKDAFRPSSADLNDLKVFCKESTL